MSFRGQKRSSQIPIPNLKLLLQPKMVSSAHQLSLDQLVPLSLGLNLEVHAGVAITRTAQHYEVRPSTYPWIKQRKCNQCRKAAATTHCWKIKLLEPVQSIFKSTNSFRFSWDILRIRLILCNAYNVIITF